MTVAASFSAMYAELDAVLGSLPPPSASTYEATNKHDPFVPRDERPIEAIAGDIENHHADTLQFASTYAACLLKAVEIHKLRERVENDQRRLLQLLNEFSNDHYVRGALAELQRKAKPSDQRAN